jgi:circadian clock protein KaiB
MPVAAKRNASIKYFEERLETKSEATYILRLFVTGVTLKSQKAIVNVRKLCGEHLAGRYDLEIIDIYQNPDAAREEQILAAPTLVKSLPEPLRRFIGDMSDTGKLMAGLDLAGKG